MVAPLSPQVFSLLSSLIEERVGMHHAPDDISVFSEKVAARLGATGFDNPLDYYYFLRYDPAGDQELVALVDTLVIGETYLFREVEALIAAVKHVIHPSVELRGRARVWSAGCSTGEEPFTLAMLLADRKMLDRVDIVATDVSSRAIARATTGVLTQRSLRALSWSPRPLSACLQSLAEQWLRLRPDGTAEVSQQIVRAIQFRRESVLHPSSYPLLFDLDLILCRNVLIYFRDDLVRRVVANLTTRLRNGGALLVGASESLLRFGTVLRCEEHGGAFFYIKDETTRSGLVP
jgi:chemotaxis protein methyltransferase CheR